MSAWTESSHTRTFEGWTSAPRASRREGGPPLLGRSSAAIEDALIRERSQERDTALDDALVNLRRILNRFVAARGIHPASLTVVGFDLNRPSISQHVLLNEARQSTVVEVCADRIGQHCRRRPHISQTLQAVDCWLNAKRDANPVGSGCVRELSGIW